VVFFLPPVFQPEDQAIWLPWTNLLRVEAVLLCSSSVTNCKRSAKTKGELGQKTNKPVSGGSRGKVSPSPCGKKKKKMNMGGGNIKDLI